MGAFKDLSGSRFGKLVVSCRDGKYRGGHIRWRCVCDCGGTAYAYGVNLHAGKTKDCGCGLKASYDAQSADLRGVVFGQLTAVEVLPASPGAKTGRKWRCVCACGRERVATAGHLRAGEIKACRTCAPGVRVASCHARNDLTGSRFGALTAVGRVPSSEIPAGSVGHAWWYCDCDCGSRVLRTTHALRTYARHCGCLRVRGVVPRGGAKRLDLTGRTFNRLTAFSPVEEPSLRGGRTRWLCKCSCGNITVAATGGLVNGTIKSCGCLRLDIRRERRKYGPGDRFGRLTILERVGKTPADTSQQHARCMCDCGRETTVVIHAMVRGTTTSCGCYQIEMSSGANHPNWNPELTDLEREGKRYVGAPEGARLRVVAYARAGYTCSACGGKDGGLTAHHIRPWRLYPDDRFKLRNLVTLCRRCHAQLHMDCGGFAADCAAFTIPWIRERRKETGHGQPES